MNCLGITTLLIHPLAGGVAAHADIALVVLHILRVFCDTRPQLCGGGAMPKGDGKETDAYSDSRADFGQVKGQARRQVIRKMGQNTLVEQEGQDKDAQLKQSGSHVKEYF